MSADQEPGAKKPRVADPPDLRFETAGAPPLCCLTAAPGGITVTRTSESVDGDKTLSEWAERLDREPGAIFASLYEFPGRYTRWDTGLVSPPLVLESRGRQIELRALHPRGVPLLGMLWPVIQRCPELESAVMESPERALAVVKPPAQRFPEEQRSRQPSVMSLVRAVVAAMRSDMDGHIGLYGAFAYDLAYQFEPVKLARPRDPAQRDVCLYLPDQLVVTDRGSGTAYLHRWAGGQGRADRRGRYEFSQAGLSTDGLARSAVLVEPFVPSEEQPTGGDHAPGEYAAKAARVVRAGG